MPSKKTRKESRESRIIQLKKKSKTYRTFSVIFGFIFVALCMLFPIWMEYINRPSIENIVLSSEGEFEETKKAEIATASAFPDSKPKGIKIKNASCRAYVIGKCAKMGISTGICAILEEEAINFPVEEGLEGCKKNFDEKIEKISKSAMQLQETEKEESEKIPPLFLTKSVDKKTERKKISIEEKKPAQIEDQKEKKNLEEIYAFVYEIQSSSYNYTTLPEAQNERLKKLKALVENTKDEKLIKIYNDVLNQVKNSPLNLMPERKIEEKEIETSSLGEVKTSNINDFSLQPGEMPEEAVTVELQEIKK